MGALPHSFVEPELPTQMESTIQNLGLELEKTGLESEKSYRRIKSLAEYFE